MSANQDPNQKVKFLFPHSPKGQTKTSYSHVIKAEDIRTSNLGSVRVHPYSPAEIIGKKVNKPDQVQNEALENLKSNLKSLNDLQARLRFMLKELEDLIIEER